MTKKMLKAVVAVLEAVAVVSCGGDMDTSPPESCAADLASDPANCGACGKACPAGYACQASACNATCATNPCRNDGVCTDLAAGGYTCTCPSGYGGADCDACLPGRADCDGIPANGCEVNTSGDAMNCGACGHACAAGQICAHSACQEPPGMLIINPPIHTTEPHGALAPAVADVDRDGKLDVLVANAESGSATNPRGTLTVRRGNGDGTLQAEGYYGDAPLSSNAVIAIDVNGDGWPDAVTVNGQPNLPKVNGSISVYLNRGAAAPGVLSAPRTYSTGTPGSLHLCAADFNGDGHPDIATTSVTGSIVSVMAGDGDGGFGMPTLIPIKATGGVQSTIATADLNGDGHPDLVATSPGSSLISVLLNKGDGTFATPVTYGNDEGGYTAGIAFGDFDRDGKLDIISNGAAGLYIYFFKGQGNGTFATGLHSPVSAIGINNSALGIVTGDFNGDGNLDAIVLHTAATGGIYPLAGSGHGTFTVGPFVQTGASPGLNALVAADVNGDGWPDLVLTDRASNDITVLLNGL